MRNLHERFPDLDKLEPSLETEQKVVDWLFCVDEEGQQVAGIKANEATAGFRVLLRESLRLGIRQPDLWGPNFKQALQEVMRDRDAVAQRVCQRHFGLESGSFDREKAQAALHIGMTLGRKARIVREEAA